MLFWKKSDILIKPKGYGRLAQLVEHLLDVQRVRDSSSLPSTMKTDVFLKRSTSVFVFLIMKKILLLREFRQRKDLSFHGTPSAEEKHAETAVRFDAPHSAFDSLQMMCAICHFIKNIVYCIG